MAYVSGLILEKAYIVSLDDDMMSINISKKKFQNWTSENSNIDNLIQESLLNAKKSDEKLEWIEYDKF